MQIKTIHGVPVPPKKRRPHRSNAQTIDFIITGSVPSKKNRQIATMNWKKIYSIIKQVLFKKGSMGPVQLSVELMKEIFNCKPFIRHSKKFQEWEEQTKQLLISQAGAWSDRLRSKGYEFSFPISEASIIITHYWKDMNIRDNSNKSETIHDLLVTAGILAGDNWQHLTPIAADADCYQGEIVDHITVIKITAYNWCKRAI